MSFIDNIKNIYKKDTKGYTLMALLVLFIIICFYPTLNNWFVYWDDPEYILENKNLGPIGEDWSWHVIKHMFTTEVGANYDPLPIFTFALEKYFFAQDVAASPFIYHLDNLLLHIACSVFVFIFFRKMGLAKEYAFLGALLFGMHPMRVESVAWITERKDVLYGTFFVLSLIYYIKYIDAANEKKKWYLFVLLFSITSYFSKIQAVSLPLSMVAIDIYKGRKWYAAKILLLEKLPWWFLSMAFALVNLYYLKTKHVINEPVSTGHFVYLERFALGAYAYICYLIKFIYPYKLVAVYRYPVHIPAVYYVCLVLVLGLLGLIWKFRHNRTLVFGWLFFTVNVMFLLQVVSAGIAFLADRFTYIAYIGLFFLVVRSIETIVNKLNSRKRWVIYIALPAYIGLLAVISFNQCKIWKNSITLWQHYVDENVDDYFGYYQVGCCLVSMALDNKPDLAWGQIVEDPYNKGIQDMLTAAAKDSVNGRQLPALTTSIYQGISMAYLRIRDTINGDYYMSKAVKFTPCLDGFTTLAILYYEQKNYVEAIHYLTEMIKLDPHDYTAYYRRALSKGFLGDNAEALPDIDSAINYYKEDPKYFIVRAQINRRLNNLEASRQDAEKAKAMGGKVPAELFQ